MRFEKVNKYQFIEDYLRTQNAEGYNADFFRREAAIAYDKHVIIPTRASAHSAGYDFVTPFSLSIAPGETIVVPTGIKCDMRTRKSYVVGGMSYADVYLQMHIRSSIGIRHHVILSNCTGIIDADYYNNPDNEGDIHLALTNIGHDTFEAAAGERLAQGIITEFFRAENDFFTSEDRSGGIGSSGK